MSVEELLKQAANTTIAEITKISEEATKENKIPKIVHFCFFNWEKLTTSEPEYVPLLQTWADVLVPQGYTFINWTKDKLPQAHILDLALKTKKWAFGADYARTYGMYTYGGIWLDCDVAVYKSFDDLLELPYILDCEYSMFATSDTRERIEAGVFGCKRNWGFLRPLLDFYNTYTSSSINTDKLCLPFLINDVTSKDGYTIHFNYGDIQKYKEWFKTHSFEDKELVTLNSNYFSKTEMDLPYNAINIRLQKVVSHREEYAYTSHQLFDKWINNIIFNKPKNN